MAALVDWELASATGTRLVPAGPRTDPGEVEHLVAGLREAAERAEHHVREVTQLDPPMGLSPTLVIDRPSWIRANVATMRELIEGRDPAAHPGQDLDAGDAPGTGVAAKAGGVETGAVLAFLAPRILGQFDPFHADHGRLLLVAPNVLKVQRELHLDLADFQLWVCLHEETHRVQFTHAGWLRDHLRTQINGLLDSLGGISELEMLLRSLRKGRQDTRDDPNATLLHALATPEQRATLDHVTAVMSLLEGHADVMMDRVGTRVVPSVHRIRRQFNQRRTASRGRLDAIVRRALGLDAKLRQYQDGAVFTRRVITRLGVAGFNSVFDGVDQLPTLDEILHPEAWIDRVHGQAA